MILCVILWAISAGTRGGVSSWCSTAPHARRAFEGGSGIQVTTKGFQYNRELLIIVPPAFKAAVAVLLEKSTAKHAGYLTVKLDLPHRPRSTGWKSQNHHLRGHARQLCGYTGFTMSEMMQVVKEDTPSWPVEFRVVRGKNRMIFASEADISVEVASEAIEMCHVYAAENGWILKESGEEDHE